MLNYLHDAPGYGSRAGDFRHRRKDGTLIDVETISYGFELDGRRVRIVVINDVTEQLRVREQQEQLQAQMLLAQKMEAVGRLAGGVAHDFNNLLSVILGAAETSAGARAVRSAAGRGDGDPRRRRARRPTLTRQLLVFSRKQVRTPGVLDLNEVVDGRRAAADARARRDIGADRAAARRAAALVVADAGQLEQVLVNLAVNARDAMPRGGTLTIDTGEATLDCARPRRLRRRARPVRRRSTVSDTGIGMDEATRDAHLRALLHDEGPAQGTGLGLATVYGIVRQSGGAIVAASAPGRGTHVRIHLPRGEAAAPPPAPVGAARSVEPRGVVLLVEDEPRVRSQVRRLLQRSGYEVVEATDGAEAKRDLRRATWRHRRRRHRHRDADRRRRRAGGDTARGAARAARACSSPAIRRRSRTFRSAIERHSSRSRTRSKPSCDAIDAVVPS